MLLHATCVRIGRHWSHKRENMLGMILIPISHVLLRVCMTEGCVLPCVYWWMGVTKSKILPSLCLTMAVNTIILKITNVRIPMIRYFRNTMKILSKLLDANTTILIKSILLMVMDWVNGENRMLWFMLIMKTSFR